MDRIDVNDAINLVRNAGYAVSGLAAAGGAVLGLKRKLYGQDAQTGANKRRKLDQSGRYQRGGYYGRDFAKGKELKFKDFTNAGNTQVDTVWRGMDNIQDIFVNADQNGRIGRKITMKKINIRATAVIAARTTLGTLATQGLQIAERSKDEIRIVIVLDRQSNGDSTDPLQVFESHDIKSFRNLSNVDRFEVICDKFFKLEAKGSGGLGNQSTVGYIESGDFKQINIQKKVNTKIFYEGGGPTNAGVTQSNRYTIFWIGHHVALGEALLNMTTIDFQVRVRYQG